MIEQPVVTTVTAPERLGGILVCGTNYGQGRNEPPEPETFVPEWAPYFTHPSNRANDKFVGGIIRWFNWWNLPLATGDGHPSELALSISQTNLFYDKSKDFEMRPSQDFNLAFARLRKTINRLDISGLLITSSQLPGETERCLGIPSWNDPLYGQRTTPPPSRFWMWFGSSGDLSVAICPHPTTQGVSQESVEEYAGVMQEWVHGILRVRKSKQVGRGNV